MKRCGADHKQSEIKLKKAASTGKKIAIVGSGPAGLAAAQDLCLWGHDVTIYEEMEKTGGMLRYGIPRFRLPEELIDQEIGQITKLGVTIKTGIRIGKDVTVETLANDFDSVIVAAGCMIPQVLNIPNEQAEGVKQGLDFMIRVNQGTLNKVHGHVVVIGGGFTAMDCARTAYRLGAEKVSIVYRRTRNELKVDDREIRETSIEGVEFYYLLSPKTIKTNGDNKVESIIFQRNRLTEPGPDGRRGVEPVEGKGSEISFDADWVIPAVSQSADKTFIDGKFSVNDDSTTSFDKVFATGDFVTGPSSIISAIGAAHKVARAVDKLLMASDRFETKIEKKEWPQIPFGSYKGWKTIEGNIFDLIPRLDNPAIPLNARQDQNLEVDKGYDKDQGYWQGQRCFLCNHNIQFDDQCILCNNCVDVCPYDCILMLREENVRVNKNGEQVAETDGSTFMVIDEKNCVRCGLCIDACPVPCITMEKMDVSSVLKQ
jgi:formate dehydrogenase major subunit